MRITIKKYLTDGKAVVHGLVALNILAVFWLAGMMIEIRHEREARRLVEEEERSHVSEFITDRKKMLATLSKCNKIEISYSSMSSEFSTRKKELSHNMLEKLISFMEDGEGVWLTLSTDYWKSSGLKCSYSYTHHRETYRFLPY
jgi:hypothetical protein